MDTNSRISRVMNAIQHKSGACMPRGELAIEATFARDFLTWKSYLRGLEELSETDLLMEFSRLLGLDLVCIQSGDTCGRESGTMGRSQTIGPISRGGFFVFWVVNGVFQTAMQRRGMMNLLMDMAESPNAVGDQLRVLSDPVAKAMVHGIEAGAHGVIIADDIAYNQNTYMSPDFVERYLLPIWQSQVATAKQSGVPVFFHSDGNLNAVLPHIVEAGFDGLQCIEPSAGMNILAIKRNYGHKLCLMGNVDPALLARENSRGATPSTDGRLACAVNALVDGVGTDSGLIFGTCSGLHHGMSPQRVDFMYRLALERHHLHFTA